MSWRLILFVGVWLLGTLTIVAILNGEREQVAIYLVGEWAVLSAAAIRDAIEGRS